MTMIKRITLGLLATIILLAVGTTLLIFTLDANLLKPVLHKAAQEQGAELSIPGDIGWQLYPNVGLSLGEVRISTLRDKTSLLSITSAAVSVKLMPLLFEREILVNGLQLDGLDAQYIVDKDGNSPWSQLGEGKASADTPTAEGQTMPKLAIDTIEITGLKLNYQDAQTGDSLLVTDAQLRSQNFAVDGQPFVLDLRANVTYNDYPPTQIAWDGPVSLNLDRKTLSTDNAQVALTLGEAVVKFDLNNNTFWGEPLNSNGKVTLHPIDMPALFKALKINPPKTASPDALQKLSAQFNYDADDKQAKISNASVTLDKTQLKGDLSIHNFAKPKIKTQWQGDSINLDNYLAPATDEQTPAEVAPPQPLPIETLQALDLDAALGFDQMQAKGLAIGQPQVQISAKKGLIKFEKLVMNVAEGNVRGNGQLDARQEDAQLALQLDSTNVDLGLLLKTLADLDNIAGSASANLTATSTGRTDQALIDNLAMDMTAKSERMTLTPFNIEEQFCKALALLQQGTPEPFDWPKLTEMKPVTMELTLREKTLNVNQLSAEIASLLGAAQGKYDMNSGDFNFPMTLSLGNFATIIPGCLPIEEKWRKRALPIRCKGNLDSIGVTTCMPDTKVIGDMIKDKITNEVKEKVAEKQNELEHKAGDNARDAIIKQVGEEKAKELENTLKGTFDALKGKKKKTEE